MSLTRVVHGLTRPVVLPRQPEPARLLEYPGADAGLDKVVHHHQALYVEGLPVLHEPGPRHPDDVVVEDTQGHCGPGGRHQEPVIYPEMSRQSVTRSKLSLDRTSSQVFVMEFNVNFSLAGQTSQDQDRPDLTPRYTLGESVD